jgi:DNA-binding NarL/FixJ family response regulator
MEKNKMAKSIRVMIVDDHSAIRAGLVHILRSEPDIEVIAEAADGQEAIEKALELKPELIIMDISMPIVSGLEATLTIKERLPDTKILIFTVSESEQDLIQAMRFGAEGFILKDSNIEEIAVALRLIAHGETILSPALSQKLVNEFRNKTSESALSIRESEVIELVSQGLTNSEVAEKLYIGETTVRTYLNRVLIKLQLKNRNEAIAYSRRYFAGKVGQAQGKKVPTMLGEFQMALSRRERPFSN